MQTLAAHLVLVGLLGGLVAAGPAHSQVAVGSLAPDALGVTIDGDEMRVSSFKGKVVVATFWASWCGPCQRELPILEGMQKLLGPEKIKVVTISIESAAKFQQIGAAARKLHLTFTHDKAGAIAAAYGVKGVPHLVVIGRDGRVVRTAVGYSEEQVDSVIAQVQAAIHAP